MNKDNFKRLLEKGVLGISLAVPGIIIFIAFKTIPLEQSAKSIPREPKICTSASTEPEVAVPEISILKPPPPPARKEIVRQSVNASFLGVGSLGYIGETHHGIQNCSIEAKRCELEERGAALSMEFRSARQLILGETEAFESLDYLKDTDSFSMKFIKLREKLERAKHFAHEGELFCFQSLDFSISSPTTHQLHRKGESLLENIQQYENFVRREERTILLNENLSLDVHKKVSELYTEAKVLVQDIATNRDQLGIVRLKETSTDEHRIVTTRLERDLFGQVDPETPVENLKPIGQIYVSDEENLALVKLYQQDVLKPFFVKFYTGDLVKGCFYEKNPFHSHVYWEQKSFDESEYDFLEEHFELSFIPKNLSDLLNEVNNPSQPVLAAPPAPEENPGVEVGPERELPASSDTDDDILALIDPEAARRIGYRSADEEDIAPSPRSESRGGEVDSDRDSISSDRTEPGPLLNPEPEVVPEELLARGVQSLGMMETEGGRALGSIDEEGEIRGIGGHGGAAQSPSVRFPASGSPPRAEAAVGDSPMRSTESKKGRRGPPTSPGTARVAQALQDGDANQRIGARPTRRLLIEGPERQPEGATNNHRNEPEQRIRPLRRQR